MSQPTPEAVSVSPAIDEATELLPCPFCGGDARLDQTTWGFYVVRCTAPACRASSYHKKDHNVVIAIWNTRLDSNAAKVEKLEASLSHILPRFDITADGQCKFCGRDYCKDIPKDYLCINVDCDAFIARAALIEPLSISAMVTFGHTC